MNSASSEMVTNFLEKSVFSWSDFISAAKSSKEYSPNHFWQIFSFLKIFIIGQTFTFYEPTYCPNWLKWPASLKTVISFLEKSAFTSDDFASAAKSFKE